ncbi:hypothetical protein DFH09DRAFT_1328037 [Mycena vulgaris]|nr:hypothetical protein DFH09DRAFT_1332778 [Mycena vulgaris]KAJ6527565.1 hypothetical protein DFH09DRAFT_1328037 [Mycena vulgaris]
MTDASLNAINAPNPKQEMDALIAKVSELTDLSAEMTRLCIAVQRVVPSVALSRASLDMTRLCLDVQAQIPIAFTAAAGVGAAAATATVNDASLLGTATMTDPAPAVIENPVEPESIDQTDWIWTRGVPLTPDQLDASFPAGVGDDLPWQVVCIGREPGLYASADTANEQLTGVPNQFRQKKSTRLEALAFYRHRYNAGKVQKWTPVPPEAASSSDDA